MNKILIAAVAALALATAGSASAAANNDRFVGPRIEATASATDYKNVRGINDAAVGGVLGVDAAVGKDWTLGFDFGVLDAFHNEDTVNVGVRTGYAVNPNTLIYGRVGYASLDDARNFKQNGLTVGAGANFALTDHLYLNTEYRYSDFNNGGGAHGGLVGVGFRF